ncbi:hypothetical protein SDJN03_23579, partial [Cucurbita argyrosperma subsp. sororia]
MRLSDQFAVTKLSTFTPPTVILQSILFLSWNSLTILVLFAGSAAGNVIFHDLPSSTIDAFVISIFFAFSGALSALLVPQRHNLATFCALYSLASMASALLLLIWGLYHSFVLGKAR